MKKVIFIAVTLISIVFFSCGGSTTTSPKVFNDTAIKIFTGANKSLEEFDAKITAGVKSSDLASIAPAADTAMDEVNAQIDKLQALNAPQGAEEYKDTVLKSLDKVKEIIETGKKYSELKEGYSKKEFNALEKEYNAKRSDLSKELKNVASAQKAFAKSIGK